MKCEKFSNVDRFCSQNLVNSVRKLLQLLGTRPTDPLPGLRPWIPLGGYVMGYSPQMKITVAASVGHNTSSLPF